VDLPGRKLPGRSYEHLAPKQAQLGKLKIHGYTLTFKVLISNDIVIKNHYEIQRIIFKTSVNIDFHDFPSI